MKVSIITPSFNQAQFLPVNLASVQCQVRADFEHIVVDPGSTDGSTGIALSASGITVIAEPDRGQSDGIAKGFSRSTGDILCWLNSDDLYPDDLVLASVIESFEENPDVDIVYGDVNFVDADGKFLRKGFVNQASEKLFASFEYQVGIVQPGVFWRRRVFEEIGGPSEEFEYCMDYELWVRMAAKGYKWRYLPRVLAHHRWWGGMKTSSRRDLSLREHCKVCDRYFGYVHWKWLDRFADYLCSSQDGVVNHAASIDPEAKSTAIRRVIDEVVSQEMLRRLSTADAPEMVETWRYLQRNYPDKKRIYFQQSDLEIVSESAADPKARERVAWNIFDVATSDGVAYRAYHVPNNFDRYFLRDWHERQLRRSADALARFRRERRGDVCVIVGNGPSLRRSDLSLLASVDTIISNFAVLSPDLRRSATILTVVNDLVARQGAIDFNALATNKVVPFWLGNHFNESDATFFVNATVKPEFGLDFVENASWRSTVSFFNLQLAHAIGYRKVVLIGFDHSYVQPKGVGEGTLISQTEDDENHFDPRYFKGKDWQAADTANMEKMYVVAKAAYERDGREIVNCTVGGCLEVFRRADLGTELAVHRSALPPSGDEAAEPGPRLLMVDSTPVGHCSATGQLKETFLGGWPESRFLQIWETGGRSSSLRLIRLGQSIAESQAAQPSLDEMVAAIRLFDPEVIYFRPIESELLFDFVDRVRREFARPLVVHMMDDWPERLRLTDPVRFLRLDQALRRLLDTASLRLSICQAMSDAYHKRYGGDWLPLANGADPSEFPARDPESRPAVSAAAPFVIRYMGALADDMTYSSVRDVANVVSALSADYPVRFEVHTMDWCRAKAESDIGQLPAVVVTNLVETSAYRRCLCEADALLIAYNFDAKSLSYIGLSLANKLPECLASGTPVLAYGPLEAATIRYLEQAGCAQLVVRQDPAELRAAVEVLLNHPARRRELGTKGRTHVRARMSKSSVQQEFRNFIQRALAAGNPAAAPVVGPFERRQLAHYDETDCIAELFSTVLHGRLMIDVGAHHGWAHAPFLKKGWRIFAFEPDEENRRKLLERLSTSANKALLTLDTRCVSNRSQKGVSFYRSEQSSGISGLSAFHESHVEAQRVDTTTLSEYFEDQELPAVDFLKIDTEGHDLFVLQGFPWARTRPAVIECEFEDTKTVPLGYTFHDLARFLLDKGYAVYVSEWHPIIRYGIRHDWNRLTRYPCELADAKGWGNLLAFRDPIDCESLVAAVRKVLQVSSGETPKAATVLGTQPGESGVVPSRDQLGTPHRLLRIVPGRFFRQTAANQWRYTHSDAAQRQWHAILERPQGTAGATYAARLTLISNRAMTVQSALARHGDTAFEAAHQRTPLLPGQPRTIALRKQFTKPHAALRIQLEVLELEGGGTADLTIDALAITETAHSVVRRLGGRDVSLQTANRLYREGDYQTALGLYLSLSQKRPLKMYMENALQTAYRLGMDWVKSEDDLAWLLS